MISTHTSIYIIVECTLPHTHCTLADGPCARHLVFNHHTLFSPKRYNNFVYILEERAILIIFSVVYINLTYHNSIIKL